MRSLSRRRFILLSAAGLAGLPDPSAAAPLPEPLKADRVRVLKAQRLLLLLRNSTTLKTYPIALGPHPRRPKRRYGDGRTPEGLYMIDGRTARTPYHRALHISYPNFGDAARARAAHVRPGGAIFIHGMPASFGHHDPVKFFVDWTNGCIAVGNIAIEEIWNAVDDGTLIDILA
ncbi:MAG TPA: L,D-transpeptidase family protein [Stellaceae bacterium]|nr:L,D-transpeptidase family protein [Stellaceae bacterium]